MLNDYRQQYVELQQVLERLKLITLSVGEEPGDRDHWSGNVACYEQQATGDADPPPHLWVGRSSVGAVTEAVAAMTQQFQQGVLKLNAVAMDEAIALRIQSIQTEISKQLRLLSMDTMFLKTARQPETSQQRRQQMADRIDLLLRYCEAILTLD